jgi:trk system potassium uptake protein TrkA
MIDYIPFIEGYTIVELAPPPGLIGKKLKEADLINRYGVQVMAIKDVITDQLNIIPTGDYLIKDSDVLILLGQQDKIEKIKDRE